MELKDFIKDGILRVIVRPNSPSTRVLGYDEQRQAVRVAVSSLPEKGRANLALVKFLTKELKSEVKLVSGSTARLKTFRVL